MKVKVDPNAINGYDNLSDEAKQALAEVLIEVPDPDYKGYVKKDVFDKKASEASELSKQLKSKMSESELAEAENQKKFADMENELKALRTEKTINGYKASYLSLGYDEATALENATALANGDLDKVFANQKTFLEKQKKQATAQAINSQPNLTTGSTVSSADLEKAEIARLRKDFGL